MWWNLEIKSNTNIFLQTHESRRGWDAINIILVIGTERMAKNNDDNNEDKLKNESNYDIIGK